jgi:hypothetical protein
MGHYEQVGAYIGALVDRKNAQYGDSFHQSQRILEVLFPKGIQPYQYQDLLTLVRVIDKLFRIANGDQGEESAWKDIAGYGILGSKEEPACGGDS